VVARITGITEVIAGPQTIYGKCFIATGADDPDGGENGWYVTESYDKVRTMLDSCLEDTKL